MKTKLLAIILSILCLVQPVMALDMIAVESADEAVISVEVTAEEATLTATAFPAAAPANAVLYEDFENLGTITNSKANITYVKEGYEGAVIGPSAQWVTGIQSAPVAKGKSWYINVNNFNYGGSVRIQNISITDIGKYTISYNIYADFDTTIFNTTKYFARFWNPDNKAGNFFDSAWTTDNERMTWLTKSYDFEIYETSGVKYIKHASTVAELDAEGIKAIELYSSISPASTTVTAPIYIDNICLTYETPVSVSFKDAGGESFAYDVAKGYAPLSVTMPTAAQLGLGYEPKFTDGDGNVYVPGQTATVTEDTVFTVGKSNVILYDTYDTHALTGWQSSLDVEYAVGEATGATFANAKIYSYNGGKAYRQDAIYGAGIVANLGNKVNLKTPGIYTVTYDVCYDTVYGEADSGTTVLADSIGVCTRAYLGNEIGQSIARISAANPTASITAKFELYERESDGVLCFKDLYGTEIETTNGVITSIRVAFVPSYPSGTPSANHAKHYAYVDNLKIEFEPYAPSAIPMASYRAADSEFAASGIRFASFVSASQKNNAAEYGYVVTRKTLLEAKVTGEESYETYLHLGGIDNVSATDTTTGENSSGVKVAAAAAYKGSIDRIYAEDGRIFDNGEISFRGIIETFFTGVIYGITSDEQKAEEFVARPYIKVDGVYYYGDCYETSYNDVYAKANA